MRFKSRKADKKPVKAKFYFDEEDQSSWVELQFITREEMSKAYKELVTEEVNYAVDPRTAKLTKVVTPDVKREDMEHWIIDHRIAGWSGIFIDDKQVEVNQKNKRLLYYGKEFDDNGNVVNVVDETGEFRKFVDEKYQLLEEMAQEQFGGISSEKNS